MEFTYLTAVIALFQIASAQNQGGGVTLKMWGDNCQRTSQCIKGLKCEARYCSGGLMIPRTLNFCVKGSETLKFYISRLCKPLSK